MTGDALIQALNLPAAAMVGQRVPKKLLLENGARLAADKRLVNDGIDAIHWLAALKPNTCGVPAYRDDTREYLEIAVLRLQLRPHAKAGRLLELLHRAVPYPVLALLEQDHQVLLSLAHKRHALKEADKVVVDGEIVTIAMTSADEGILRDFLAAMDMARQPATSLLALYEGWMDVLIALQSSAVTGTFNLLDSQQRRSLRRQALADIHLIDTRAKALQSAARGASQMARRIEINMELQQLRRDREQAMQLLRGRA
ncbi:MAG: DUF4391 domain-containing protein [Pseudoxanthomonas suwonensis]|nr:DUF4391 domain-containing protein [Pseudoxanthomonas suwonensis]